MQRSIVSASSRKNAPVRKLAAQRPVCARRWQATRTLSSTLISPKSRMFWKVRAAPAAQI